MPIFSCGAVITVAVEHDRALGRRGRGRRSRRSRSTCRSRSRRRRRRSRPARPSARRRRARARRWDRSCRRGRATSIDQASARARSGPASAGTASTASDDQPVGDLAENGEGDDGGDDLRRLAELLAVDQQIAEPSEAPMNSAATTNIQPSPSPERSDDHVGRQHRRQQDAAHHGGAGEAEHAADLDDLAIDRHRSRPSRRDRPGRTRRPRSE